MKDLNEQLAVEVMGWEKKNSPVTQEPMYVSPNKLLSTSPQIFPIATKNWNPTTNLNQLRMCYLALSEGERKDFWLSVVSLSFEQEAPELLDIFENQEMYAQAILKAKGVS